MQDCASPQSGHNETSATLIVAELRESGFRPSGTRRCFVSRVDPDVSKERRPFIFTVKQSEGSFETSGTAHRTTRRHIPVDLNLCHGDALCFL